MTDDFVSMSEPGGDGNNPNGDAFANVEQEASHLRSQIKEERFFWALVLTILLDLYFFTQMRNWGGPVVIGALEGVGLLVLAQKCEVDAMMPFIDRVLDGIPRRNGNS